MSKTQKKKITSLWQTEQKKQSKKADLEVKKKEEGFFLWCCSHLLHLGMHDLRCGTVDAGIKVPSVENPEVTKCFPFKAKGRSEYSQACFTHCQKFLPFANFYLPCPFTFIFFKSFPYILAVFWLMQFPVWAHGIIQVTLLRVIVTSDLNRFQLLEPVEYKRVPKLVIVH